VPVPMAAHFSIPESGIEPSPRAINVRASDRLGQDEMLRLFFTAAVCALTLLPAGAQTSGRRPG
jgi:hypothetical protein